jgi:2-methylcitrate dehydratase PrpD
MNLDPEQFGHAMGLAASQASGLKANFGTMTKPFHAGHAAERGLLSTRLAARGYTANPDAFCGRQGLLDAAGDGAVDETRLAGVADQWIILQTLFKYHAACYLTHSAIEAALRLRASVVPGDLTAVTVTVHPSLMDVCGIPAPRTGLEAKFSLAGTTAMALLGMDTSDPASFEDAVVRRADLLRLVGKVRVETDRDLSQTQAVVVLQDKAQRAFRAEHDSGVPATDLAVQETKLKRKFLAMASLAVGADAEAFEARVEALTALDDVRRFF